MPMSVIPAAIMGAKAASPCVAVGNIFNMKTHPASPTAAACLLPLVGKDYLSYGNLNALATGKISAETKPRPLSSMEYAEDQSPGRRHSEPGPTTSSKAGQDPVPTLPNDTAARVIRKKTSFASKLRKVFIIKPAQSNKGEGGDEGRQGQQQQSLTTPQQQQLQHLQLQEQHRGSVSSSSSGDTAVGYGEGTTATSTTIGGHGQGEGGLSRSREGSASSQPYSPVTSPELSPTGSPKFQLASSASCSSPMGVVSMSGGESTMESSGVGSGTGSSETAQETTPTRTVKKRLSFASISSFFQPRNNGSSGSSASSSSSSSSSNNSDDSAGARDGTATVSASGEVAAGRSDVPQQQQQQQQQQESKSKKKTKQQRSSSVPNVEHPLSIVGRQLAGFQRRHSLNDLHGDGKSKEQDDVYKQNGALQRKTQVAPPVASGSGASTDGTAQTATDATTMATADEGANPHGTKRTFNVFQASFSSLSRKNKMQQQQLQQQQQQQQQQQASQQSQKQKQTRPAQPLRSALRRLPPPPALETLPGTAIAPSGATAGNRVSDGSSNGGGSGAPGSAAESRARKSPSIRSQGSSRGGNGGAGGAGGRRHGPVPCSGSPGQASAHYHQHPYHHSQQHRHSESTTARQPNGTTSTPPPRGKNNNNGHHLAADDASRPPRPRLSFIQVDDQDEEGYVYCTSSSPNASGAVGEDASSSGYAYTTPATNADVASGQTMQGLVMPTPTKPHGLQNGGGVGNTSQPTLSCCSFLSETSDDGSMHDVASGEEEDDEYEEEVELVVEVGQQEDEGVRRRKEEPAPKASTATTAGRRSKKRHHASRQQHLQQQQQHNHHPVAHPPQSPPQHQQYYPATPATGSDQYRSVLPTNAARISVDRIVMEQDGRAVVISEHDDPTGAVAGSYLQHHQDAVMTSPTSSLGGSHGGSDHHYHAGEYTYDPYSTGYAYDAVQLPSQHLVYQLEQQPYASSSSTGSSTSTSSTYTSSYPSAAYIDGSIYHHPAYLHQHLLSMPAPQQSAGAPAVHTTTTATAARPVRQIQFSTDQPIIHATWTAEQYDRTSDANITALRLTPAIAQKIKLELNMFKSQEMAVHQDSRIYTHFFV
ncbi:hypothetical protein DFQ26_008346 [Actinomortierella ambigua]|nr:hypothetical protein DFQ26_008346 [Actinomortierella ambigua]